MAEVKEYVRDPRGHVWQTYDDGTDAIDPFAFEAGNHCNGPRCVLCGYGFCHHCSKGKALQACTATKPASRDADTILVPGKDED